MNATVGFIGLGNLGTPIAVNLVQSGRKVFVYNRTASKTTALAALGANVADSIVSLARECSVVFTMVSDDAALKAVVSNGLLDGLQPGAIHISMSTILPETAKELHELHRQKQQHYLAAPVFGRPEAAVARKLNVVMSGDEKIREQAAPVLKDAGAAGIWDFGDSLTAANTIKLCGNFLIASALEAIGESIALARQSGVDPQLMWNMFTQTLFATPVYQNYSNIILQKKFEPAAFTAKLGLKDVNLALQQAASVRVSMPLALLLQTNMQRLVNEGKQDIDWSAVATAVSPN
ncbi:MAG TPA: NAD(P)-dependent oxidoreductase [Puia sp.]|nr:NAD(P)-dependent oxidoreductase [Puia sp.]